jgi:hypothetical protein
MRWRQALLGIVATAMLVGGSMVAGLEAREIDRQASSAFTFGPRAVEGVEVTVNGFHLSYDPRLQLVCVTKRDTTITHCSHYDRRVFYQTSAKMCELISPVPLFSNRHPVCTRHALPFIVLEVID